MKFLEESQIYLKFLEEVQTCPDGSLGREVLDRLKGTGTERAFMAAGEAAWKRYWEGGDWSKGLSTETHDFRVSFFTELIGQELYDRITKEFGYPAAVLLHNPYIIWGRANMSVVEV